MKTNKYSHLQLVCTFVYFITIQKRKQNWYSGHTFINTQKFTAQHVTGKGRGSFIPAASVYSFSSNTQQIIQDFFLYLFNLEDNMYDRADKCTHLDT